MRELLALMRAVGFTHVEYIGNTGVETSRYTLGATFRARKSG
ncbi:MAG: hypothetical protein ABIK28_17365 [Planctomycetota bacterium]